MTLVSIVQLTHKACVQEAECFRGGTPDSEEWVVVEYNYIFFLGLGT